MTSGVPAARESGVRGRVDPSAPSRKQARPGSHYALHAGSPAGGRRGASGRSAAWLARLPWEQEAGSSNLPVPMRSTFLSMSLMTAQKTQDIAARTLLGKAKKGPGNRRCARGHQTDERPESRPGLPFVTSPDRWIEGSHFPLRPLETVPGTW